eukprot:3195624-Rhodomonas_salina.1
MRKCLSWIVVKNRATSSIGLKKLASVPLAGSDIAMHVGHPSDPLDDLDQPQEAQDPRSSDSGGEAGGGGLGDDDAVDDHRRDDDKQIDRIQQPSPVEQRPPIPVHPDAGLEHVHAQNDTGDDVERVFDPWLRVALRGLENGAGAVERE